MTDRKNVVSKLDELRQFADTEIHPIVSPDNWDVYSKLCDLIDLTKEEVLALLKEQEAVPVVQRELMHMLFWCCGSCGVAITHGDKFCRNCGKAMKWND